MDVSGGELRKIHYSNGIAVLFFGFPVKFIKLELALLLIRPTIYENQKGARTENNRLKSNLGI